MNHEFDLQLFADGGGVGAAAAAPGDGDGGGAATQSDQGRLRELGVPEQRLQKRAKRAENRKKGDVETEAAVAAMAEPTEAPRRHEPAPAPADNRRSYDIRSHYDGMYRQAAEMAGKYPDFDLQKELDNPTFLRLTGPEIGLGLEDAYMALHHRELTRAIAEGSRQELSNAIRAGSARPAEHGMGAKAPGVVTFDYRNASKSQRAAFKKEIFDAAARGEKIYPC